MGLSIGQKLKQGVNSNKNIVFMAVIVTLPVRGHYDNIKHNSKDLFFKT